MKSKTKLDNIDFAWQKIYESPHYLCILFFIFANRTDLHFFLADTRNKARCRLDNIAKTCYNVISSILGAVHPAAPAYKNGRSRLNQESYYAV